MIEAADGARHAPINRARALIIWVRPQHYAPARLREATRYLLDRWDTTEEEPRLAVWRRMTPCDAVWDAARNAEVAKSASQ